MDNRLTSKVYSEDILWETMEAFDGIASSYRRRPWGIIYSVLNENTMVVGDIGCGPGHNIIAVLREYKRVRGIALDYSYNMVYRAYRRSVSEGLGYRMLAIQCDMRRLPFRDNVFDALLYIASIHHVPLRMQRRSVLKEAYRVLVRGGVLLVTVWARYQLYFLPVLVKNIVARLRGSIESIGDIVRPWKTRDRVYNRYYHLYSLRELVEDILDTGFKLVDKGIYYPKRSLLKPFKNYYVIALK